jgi:hypothetical protein
MQAGHKDITPALEVWRAMLRLPTCPPRVLRARMPLTGVSHLHCVARTGKQALRGVPGAHRRR